jgi:hypothetical protein
MESVKKTWVAPEFKIIDIEDTSSNGGVGTVETAYRNRS